MMIIGGAAGGGVVVLLIIAFIVIAYKLVEKSKENSDSNKSVPISYILKQQRDAIL